MAYLYSDNAITIISSDSILSNPNNQECSGIQVNDLLIIPNKNKSLESQLNQEEKVLNSTRFSGHYFS